MITHTIQENRNSSILNRIRQQDQETLSAMYPEISQEEMANKYKLFLEFWFYFPYVSDNIYADITINTKSGKNYTIPKYKVRNPFYNRKYCIVSMQNKRKISRRGLPLVFDSFDELEDIESILCNWTIEYNDKLICELQICYFTSFEKEDGKTFYGIFNKDLMLSDAKRLGNLEDYTDQYDDISYCTGSDESEVISTCKKDYGLTLRNSLLLIATTEKYSEKYELEKNEQSVLYSYCAEVILQPFTETRMLPCSYAYR